MQSAMLLLSLECAPTSGTWWPLQIWACLPLISISIGLLLGPISCFSVQTMEWPGNVFILLYLSFSQRKMEARSRKRSSWLFHLSTLPSYSVTKVLSMPMIFALGYFEGFPGTLLELAVRRQLRGEEYETRPIHPSTTQSKRLTKRTSNWKDWKMTISRMGDTLAEGRESDIHPELGQKFRLLLEVSSKLHWRSYWFPWDSAKSTRPSRRFPIA